MKINRGYDKMLKMMADFGSGYLDPFWKKRKAGESLELPTNDGFSDVFHGFSEISGALEALALTEQLLRLAPPRSKRVDKDSYLKFVVGSYLQEMYILEQRLTAYAKRLSRLYCRPSLPSEVRRVVYEPLEGIVNIRGAHVHQRRFSDERLDMVSTLALFRRANHGLGDDLELEYRRAQHEWSERVRNNNQATRKIVDEYFILLEDVMCEEGKVVLPK